MPSKTKALIELNIATVLLGVTPLFAKLISLSSPQIILGRMFFGVVALGIFLFFTHQQFALKSRKDYFKIVLLAILVSLHWLTSFEAVKVSSVAVGMISLFTFPVITALLEPYFFKERLKLIDVGLAFVVLFGVMLIVPAFDLSNNVTQGVVLGVISALLYSIRNILVKRDMPHYSASILMFYQLLIGVVLFFPYLFIDEWHFAKNDLLYLVIVGVIFTALSHSLFINSLSKFKAKTASIITSAQLVWSTLAAWLILSEIPDLRTAIGGLIILASVIFETYKHA